MSGGEGISITARTRIELPRYRLRGISRIRFLPPGSLRIDFTHSSLFGAYREDSSIFIDGGRMEIYDRERGLFYEADSACALVSEAMGFRIVPDDFIVALAMSAPSCSEMEDPEFREDENGWMLAGVWRDRAITASGTRGGGPERLRIEHGGHVNDIRYTYDEGEADRSYPSRITLVRDGGGERISLTIGDVKRESLDPAIFRWRGYFVD